MTAWTPWLIPVCVAAHLVEEYAVGDFLAWFRRVAPGLAPAMTRRWAVAINASFAAACVLVALPGAPAVARLGVGVVLAVNGALHGVMSLKTQTHSPGVVTGVVLYLPLAGALFVHESQAGRLSWPVGLMALAIGLVLHAVPVVTLRWRTRRIRAKGRAA